MIIDFHTHIFPDRMAAPVIEQLSRASGTLPYSDGTAGGLLRSMDAAKICCSVTLPVATNPEKVSNINRSAVLELPKEGLIPFGAMHPDCPYWKDELRLLAENGCKGIKIHPVYQGVDLDDLRYLRILDEAGSLGLTVVTHTGDDIGFPGVIHCSPEIAMNALRQVGPVNLVLAHMGGWHCWDRVSALAGLPNVYIDTSFSMGKIRLRPETPPDTDLGLMNAKQMTALIRNFGADKVLFGTDSPWADQSQAAAQIEALELSAEEKEQIFWKNAASLLNLK